MPNTDSPGTVLRAISLGAIAAAFSPDIFDEAACRARVLLKLHPDGALCPACGLALDGLTEKSFWAGRRCECGRCGRWFSARSGTFLDNAHLSYAQIIIIAALLREGLHPARIAAFAGVSADTVRIWSMRFKAFDY